MRPQKHRSRAYRRRCDRQVSSARRFGLLRRWCCRATQQLRYPLIDGQGNWIARRSQGFAAMRYTESKLTPLRVSAGELGQGRSTGAFDGTWRNVWLPSRVPNVLLNGTTGIAVGMATDIPPLCVKC
jgi:DNA gyrase/topoisomerase IV subunit A